jgi:hypothetical protein
MPHRVPVTVKLELVEGTAAELPGRTFVEVKGVMYAHLAGSQNLSNCTLLVTRDGQTIELGLSNAHDGSKVSETAFGWRFNLEMADPYHQPSRATVEATRL